MAADGNWRYRYWVTFAVEAVLLLFFIFFFEESKYIATFQGRTQETLAEEVIIDGKKGTDSVPQFLSPKHSHSDDNSTTGPRSLDPTISLLTWRQRMRLVTPTDEILLHIAWISVRVLFQFPVVMYTALQYAFALCWISAQASLVSMVFTQPPLQFRYCRRR